ncbi:MAG TPA: hypothetical protein VGR19_08930 [Allosphingosinicella sp.]|nr:hypothetical protein [Allosphingosinicella sp.]
MKQHSLNRAKHLAVAAMGSALLLTGCATPSARIADQLGGYGLNPVQALCVGQRLQANLSLSQLQQLARAAGALTRGDTTPGRLTPTDLFRVASQIRDPKIAIEVARAASSCGVLGSFL